MSEQPPYQPPVPAPQPAPPYQPAPSTDGFAIASLVLSLLGVSLLGLIFGIIGLRHTKDGARPGRGLAVAGTIISAIGLVLTLVIVGVVTWGVVKASNDAPKSLGVSVGDCYENYSGSLVDSSVTVPCASKHRFEVMAPASSTTTSSECTDIVGTVSNAYDTSYVLTTAKDPYTGEYWCIAQTDPLGVGYWTGSFYNQDAQPTSF